MVIASNHSSGNSYKEGDRNAGNGKDLSSRPSSSSSSSTHKVKREYTDEDASPQQRKANKERQQGNSSRSSKPSSKPRSDGVKKEIDTEKAKLQKEGGSAKREDETIEKRKPGQKNATPTPGQADRVFYETLLKQRPESHMAQDWCLAYGVLGEEESHELYKLVCKRKGPQPTKNTPPLATSPTTTTKKSSGGSRPRSSLPKEMDADTGFEPTGVFEGVGTTGL